MNIVIMQEQVHYSGAELYKKINSQLTDEIIRILLGRGILKAVKAKDMDSDEMDFISDNLIIKETSKYRFEYVGLLIIRDCCFIIYPKYIKNVNGDIDDDFKKIRQILRVIEKSKYKKYDLYEQDLYGEENFNLLSFTLVLIHDYYENGIYSNDKMLIEENGGGEVLWDKTINEQEALLFNGRPVYLNLYTMNTTTNEEDFCRRLHKCIITRCCSELEDVLKFLGIDTLNLSSEELEDFGDKEYVSYILENEYNQQFISSKQQILKRLHIYINQQNSNHGDEKISCIGTKSYNGIWETVCKEVLGDQLNKSLAELNLKPYGDVKKTNLLIDIVPKPEWIHYDSQKSFRSNRTLIPDIVRVKNHEIEIFDAKYYDISFSDSGVSGQPGVEDITKQYLYELSYATLAKENNIVISQNAFLMPADGEKIVKLGKTKMEIFDHYKDFVQLNDIEVYLLPCGKVYDAYLNN